MGEFVGDSVWERVCGRECVCVCGRECVCVGERESVGESMGNESVGESGRVRERKGRVWERECGRTRESAGERVGGNKRESVGEQERIWVRTENVGTDLDLSLFVFLVCLLDLILNVPSTIFQLNRDGSSWVEPVLS